MTSDMGAETLRITLEKIAEKVSQRLTESSAHAELFAVSDVLTLVEQRVGDVVHTAEDFVSKALDFAHDLVNALENAGERMANVTEHAVHAITVETQQVVGAAKVVTAAQTTITEVTFVGITVGVGAGAGMTDEPGLRSSAGGKGVPRASIAQLIQVRRALILEQRKAIIAGILAKRDEINAQVFAVATRIASRRSSV